jgi:hypothetical protein
MTAVATGLDHLTLEITEEIRVNAPLDTAFAALLEELGPANRGQNDVPMPMMLEPWPGGRWFRDLGNGNGHFWGHVQAIKAPALLEINGPLWMSFPVASNVQYRFKEENGSTLITLKHTAFGLFPEGYSAPASQGWKNIFERVRQRVEAAR